MQVTTDNRGPVGIVRVGEARLMYPLLSDFSAVVAGLIGEGRRDILIDVSPVTYVDSATIGCFMDLYRQVSAGGGRLKLDNPGWYVQPTLIADTDKAMRINNEEVFGPVASTVRVKNYEEALAVANSGDFGLSAGIVTTSLKYARDFQRRVRAGMVMVNLPTAGVDYHVPFGGRKASSHGPREQGRYAAEFYTTVKTAYTRA